MKRFLFITAALLLAPQTQATGMAGADPLLFKGMINHLEQSYHGDEKAEHWDVEVWLGRDFNKLWFKSDGERHDEEIEQHRLQLLYSRAIAPYWDLQLGIAHDVKESPSENWLALAVHGTAPYYIDTELELYLGEKGHSSLQLSVAQEWMFTQRLALEPELDLNLNGKASTEHGIGQGLSRGEFSLRLHYEISRKFAPYLGASWSRKFSETAELGGDRSSDQWVIGVSGWF